MKNKTIFILRGTSHSGKSTLARELIKGRNGVICTADDLFEDINGNYNFDVSKLGFAHKQCQDKFVRALEDIEVDIIVVANTNCNPLDMEFYKREAEKTNAMIFFLVVERRHNNKNHHEIPLNVLGNQERRLSGSLKLI